MPLYLRGMWEHALKTCVRLSYADAGVASAQWTFINTEYDESRCILDKLLVQRKWKWNRVHFQWLSNLCLVIELLSTL